MNLQAGLTAWLLTMLGIDRIDSPQDRAMRVLEEAIELAQAAGIPEKKVRQQAAVIYSRPAGSLTQETAGVINTALLMAESLGVDGVTIGARELDSAWERIDDIRRKNLTKVQA